MKIKKILIVSGIVFLLTFIAIEVWGHILSRRDISGPSKAVGAQSEKQIKEIAAANEALKKKLKALAPKGVYIVIDTARNKVYWKNEEKTLREMVASCGTGNVLEDPAGGRKWVFDTPRGRFKVKNKVTNPVWVKPDWAFIEEGEAPPKDYGERMDYNAMGDYAIGIGNGYFIHGTLYKRLLGRNVSHGCIRLGDEDLEFLYKTAPVGTTVLIF